MKRSLIKKLAKAWVILVLTLFSFGILSLFVALVIKEPWVFPIYVVIVLTVTSVIYLDQS